MVVSILFNPLAFIDIFQCLLQRIKGKMKDLRQILPGSRRNRQDRQLNDDDDEKR
jgi:hypothetical protein